MTIALLWSLLCLKHILFAHVLDFGFSQSRNVAFNHWSLAFVQVTTLELAATAVILLSLSWMECFAVVVCEMLILSTCTWLDRHPKPGRELKTHIYGELSLLLFYGSMVWYLYAGRQT